MKSAVVYFGAMLSLFISICFDLSVLIWLFFSLIALEDEVTELLMNNILQEIQDQVKNDVTILGNPLNLIKSQNNYYYNMNGQKCFWKTGCEGGICWLIDIQTDLLIDWFVIV